MAEENSNVQNVQDPKTSACAITGLVLGIVGLVGSWVPILNNFSFFLAIAGLIFAIIGAVSVAKSKGKKKGKGMAIAGVILCVISMIAVLATQSMYGKAIDSASESFNESMSRINGDATDEILNKDVSVDFGSYKIDSKTSGSYTSKEGYLEVTVKNLTTDSKSYSIQMEAVDSSNNRIKDGYIYANSLAGGQSKSEKVFQAYGDESIQKYNGATFKIVKVEEY